MKPLDLSFLGNISDEDKILLNRTAQWAFCAENKYQLKYSFFLDERQAKLCETVLKSIKFDSCCFYGGYEDAKRKIIGFFPPFSDPDKNAFPIVPVTFTYRKSDNLSHRDFLGSLMSLRISRETVGDIIVSEGESVIFLYKTIAEYVLQNMNKIGRTGVKCNIGYNTDIIPVQKFEEIKGTAAALRLDCIVSLALRISREKAAGLISTSGAEVNHLHITSPSFQLSEGDEFSVKGYGKFILLQAGGITKKQRIHITLTKYV
ncbi:RNA-binding protein [Hominimerdicola sp. 21CYCFAH17_S]